MKQFRYEAKKGITLTKGILTAENKEAAIDQLNKMGLLPVEVNEDSLGSTEGERGRTLRQRVGKRILAIFYRKLGRLLKSGVPLLPALALMSEQAENKDLKVALESVKNDVRQGQSLALTMSKHPDIFNVLSTSMVELGESTGSLPEVFERLADCYEKQALTTQKVKAALVYPSLVILLGIAAVIFLLSVVVPQFSKLFESMGKDLPVLTTCLMNLSSFMRQYGLLLLIIAAISFFLFSRWLNIYKNRIRWDYWKMRLPFFGNFFIKTQVAFFSRSMEMLLRGGVPLLKALRMATPVVMNEAMKEKLFQVVQKVEQGLSLSESLRNLPIFPIFSVHLILLGEQTGRLEQSFNDIADWYEQEVEESANVLTQLIEPVTILVIGIILGFIAMAILLPAFSIDAIVM